MTEPARIWPARKLPPDLAARYVRAGYWTDDSLGQMLTAAAAERADVPVRVVSQARPWRGTHGGLMDGARQLAGGLRARGIEAGDPIVVCLPNWAEAIMSYWAALILGAVIVPVTHQYRARELTHILRETNARALIASGLGDNRHSLELMQADIESMPSLLLVGIVPGGEGTLDAPKRVAFQELLSDAVQEVAAVEPSSVALIAYTSGSTAEPKGVIHTHQTLGFELRQLDTFLDDYHKTEPVLVGTPIGHMNGLLGLMGSAMRCQSVILLDRWDPEIALNRSWRNALAG